MSRIGKMPIPIPSGVEAKLDGRKISVKGPLGELDLELHHRPKVEIDDGNIVVTRVSESRQDKSLHGLTRSLIANMVEGVTKGFEKELEIIGLGYRVEARGKGVVLNVGFSHPVSIEPIEGITFEVQSDRNRTAIKVKGIDKQLVGWVAAEIRKVKPPEPYKGKGIRYAGETVRRKVGKAGV